MTNKLSETKFFNSSNQIFGFAKAMSKINLNDYKVPEELYKGRIDVFKGYKVPLAIEVYNYIKAGKIIPALFDESADTVKVHPNIHIDLKFPHSMFNVIGLNSKGEPVCYVDLSYKAKYDKDQLRNPIYLDIPDIHLFYMCLAGYINVRLAEDNSISKKTDFMSIISSTYSLILTKIIDNMFPVASSSNTDYDKLYFLCAQFCLEAMFKMSKEEASKYATKTAGIINKADVLDSSIYMHDNSLFFNNCDFVNKFPIDNFCEILCKEYPTHITAKNFNPSALMLKYSNRLTKNSWFALEHLGSFMNMLILSKGGLGIFNDSIIKRYLEIQSKDPLKELAILVR